MARPLLDCAFGERLRTLARFGDRPVIVSTPNYAENLRTTRSLRNRLQVSFVRLSGQVSPAPAVDSGWVPAILWRVAQTQFDGWIAGRYEPWWPELFDAAVVDPAVYFLAVLAVRQCGPSTRSTSSSSRATATRWSYTVS